MTVFMKFCISDSVLNSLQTVCMCVWCVWGGQWSENMTQMTGNPVSLFLLSWENNRTRHGRSLSVSATSPFQCRSISFLLPCGKDTVHSQPIHTGYVFETNCSPSRRTLCAAVGLLFLRQPTQCLQTPDQVSFRPTIWAVLVPIKHLDDWLGFIYPKTYPGLSYTANVHRAKRWLYWVSDKKCLFQESQWCFPHTTASGTIFNFVALYI